jgi:hypothetical protein
MNGKDSVSLSERRCQLQNTAMLRTQKPMHAGQVNFANKMSKLTSELEKQRTKVVQTRETKTQN